MASCYTCSRLRIAWGGYQTCKITLEFIIFTLVCIFFTLSLDGDYDAEVNKKLQGGVECGKTAKGSILFDIGTGDHPSDHLENRKRCGFASSNDYENDCGHGKDPLERIAYILCGDDMKPIDVHDPKSGKKQQVLTMYPWMENICFNKKINFSQFCAKSGDPKISFLLCENVMEVRVKIEKIGTMTYTWRKTRIKTDKDR